MKKYFFQTDELLRIISWNNEIAAFTGKPADMSLGKPYYEVLPRISLDGKDALATAIKKNKALSLKKHRIPCLFAHIDSDVFIRPGTSSNGGVKRTKVTLSPSSTCVLAERLHQSQRLINIGKIASTLAHGVRNPLNAIKGAVVYLSEKYHQEEHLMEFTKIIDFEISRLEYFISNFLNSSILDTDIEETDVNFLLKRIEVMISLQIYTQNIQARFEFGTVLPIRANSFHIEQAILNIINNSIQAMDNGGLLTIETLTEELSGAVFVVISISDTGRGLKNKALGRMPDARKEGGRGFGLYISNEIVRHYGGHLKIDSADASGTTIKIFIPCQNTP